MVGLRDVYVVAPAASFHHHHHHTNQESLLSSADHPIIPLLSAAPCLVDQEPHPDSRSKSTTPINLTWQQNPNPSSNNNNPYLKKPPFAMLDTTGILTASSGSAGTITCQDCGNQAKKDCSHRRCRTCCKTRGFDCSTHLKSTWVPAARRRERQLSASTGAPAGGCSSASTSASKKRRHLTSQPTTSHTSTSNTTRSFDTSSSHQDASFRETLPGQVRAPAMFKCVRVTSVEDEGEDEYAYQAMVKIGGHVFKGFLYDQGEENRENNSNNNNNNAIPNISEIHLGGASTSGGGGGRNGSSSAAMVPTDIYGGPGVLLGGTNYGNPIN